MKSLHLLFRFFFFVFLVTFSAHAQKLSGKATYISKTKMELGNWGARMSEAQKKQVANRLKNRLEKTYGLTFNTTESSFKEEEKIDAISGATDSWGLILLEAITIKIFLATN